MEQNIIAVSQVNEYIKFLLDRDELLTNLCVRGEVSNYKIYPSGHHYFTLKDAEGALKCVMFRSSAQRLRFRPALLQCADGRRRGRFVCRVRAAEGKALQGGPV